MAARSARRLAAGTLAATLTVSGAAACGNDKDSGSDPSGQRQGSGRQETQAVQTAYRKTTDSKTARLSMTERIVTDEGKSVQVKGGGVIDFGSGDSNVTIKAGTGGGGGDLTVEQRTVDSVLYQKLPEKQRDLVPGKKPWIRIDLKKVLNQRGNGSSGDSGSPLAGSPQLQDPGESLSYLKGLSDDDVKKIGTERVTGVRTTHYRVNVDVDKLAESVPNEEQARQLRSRLGTGSLPLDVWLDQDGKLRREKLSTKVKDPSGSSGKQNGRVDVTVEFSDFGTEADVSAPPSGQVADLTKQAASGSGKSS